jgi:hypothetical protein
MGLPNVTGLRFFIIAWSSMVDARNVTERKERGGEKVNGWNLSAVPKQNRPMFPKKK